MAMLAEPRQRKRYILIPRGKPLYEDENRFGTKMLEKMGWKKGEGLGAKGCGSKDFVRVRFKNDALGFGFEERDDQWTQHEQNFNGLLKTLNTEEKCDDILNKELVNDESVCDMPPRIGFGFQEANVREDKVLKTEKLKDKISGISLEQVSKQSRARVHYKKFTKGKDLSQYSEKDLANIFGKKAAEDQNDFFHSLNNIFEEKPKNSDSMIYTGLCINNNFKRKNEENFTTQEDNLERTVTTKSKKKSKHKDENAVEKIETKNCKSQTIHSNILVSDSQTETESLRNGKTSLNCENNISYKNSCDKANNEKVSKKKKKRDKEIKCMENDYLLEHIEQKAKKRKHKYDQENEFNNEIKNEAKSNKINIETVEFAFDETNNKKEIDQLKNEIDTGVFNENITTRKRKIDNSSELSIGTIPPELHIPRKNKQKKSKAKEKNLLPDLDENKKDVADNSEKKKKTKKSKESIETSSKEIINLPEIVDDALAKNSPKDKSKYMSSGGKNALDLEDIKQQYESFKVYAISSFCAEKFSNMNVKQFNGSSLSQIEGYGLDPDLQLDVKINRNDKERITKLWQGELNKYTQFTKPKKTYRQYVQKAIVARNTKQKRPKLHIKTWKRKNAFQVI